MGNVAPGTDRRAPTLPLLRRHQLALEEVEVEPEPLQVALIAVQAGALLVGEPQYIAPAAGCEAAVIIGSSLAALRARKIGRSIGRAGLIGGVAVLAVGIVEGAAGWTLAGDEVYASVLGFMIWVVVAATYLLRR